MRQWISLIENELDMTPYEGSGPLYHGTDLIGLYGIITGNYLHQSIDQEHNPKRAGVSLTYDLRMAWNFAERSSEIFDSNHGTNSLLRGGIVILDSDKLREKYRLVNYWDDPSDNEKEVRVLTPRILNLSDFMIGYLFSVDDLNRFAWYLSSEYGIREHGPNTLGGLIELTKSPLFKPA